MNHSGMWLRCVRLGCGYTAGAQWGEVTNSTLLVHLAACIHPQLLRAAPRAFIRASSVYSMDVNIECIHHRASISTILNITLRHSSSTPPSRPHNIRRCPGRIQHSVAPQNYHAIAHIPHPGLVAPQPRCPPFRCPRCSWQSTSRSCLARPSRSSTSSPRQHSQSSGACCRI